MSSCPICFESLLQMNTASPDVCDHIFCLTCLTKWSKHESFCPVDRKRFKKIIDLSSDTAVQIKRTRRKKSKTFYDISVYCEICTLSCKDDTLLLCDCCDLGYHCECLTPPLKSVPSGRWCCPICVSVEAKMKKSKGDAKGAKPVSNSKKSLKRRYSKPGCSSMFSKSCSSSVSTPSTSDASHSDLEILPKRFRSCRTQDLGKKYLDSEEINSNDSNSCCLPQENEILVSEQDYKVLSGGMSGKGSYVLPGISISPRKITWRRSKENNECNTASVNEKPPQFSVFEKLDNSFTSKQKYTNMNSDFNETLANLQIDLNHGLKKHVPESHGEREVFEERKGIFPFMDKTMNDNSNHLALSEASCEASSGIPVDYSTSGSSNAEDCYLNQQLELNINDCDSETNSTHKLKASSAHKTESNPSINSTDDWELECNPLPNLAAVSNREMNSVESSVCLGLIEFKSEESNSAPNPLLDFELRQSQYALKAKTDLQKQLQKIEQEKWKYWVPPKRLRRISSFSHENCGNLLDVPRKRTAVVERNANSDRSGWKNNIFNIGEYTERVRRGTWQPENIVILERHRDNAYGNHQLKSQTEEQLASSCSLNVFQVPDSQNDFVNDDKCLVSMTSFNTFECKNDSKSSNCSELQRNLLQDNKSQVLMTSFNPQNGSKSSYYNKLQRNFLQAALHVDFEELSMREDGSLYLNWAKSNS